MGSSVVVLLGAGASVEAGLPTMWQVIEGFHDHIQADEEVAACFAWLRTSLDRFAEASSVPIQVDLELLLEALFELDAFDTRVLTAFVKDDGWVDELSPHRQTLSRVRRLLFQYLRESLDVSPDRTEYFRPLLEFAQGIGGIDLFTLNYDLLVEVSAAQLGISCTDGFGAGWDPELLDDARFEVHLHKLHGSLLWYALGQRGEFTKVPLRPGAFPPEGAHFLGESLSEVMIYPGPGKALYAEPYAGLFERFRARLSEASLLIVVGCSLRDAHIRRATLEALTANRGLNLVLIDPKPSRLLNDSDALFCHGLQFKSFSERIVTLPMSAGHAFATRQPIAAMKSVQVLQQRRDQHVEASRTATGDLGFTLLGWVLAAARGGFWGTVRSLVENYLPLWSTEVAHRAEREQPAIGDHIFWCSLIGASAGSDECRAVVSAAIMRTTIGGWHRGTSVIVGDSSLRATFPSGSRDVHTWWNSRSAEIGRSVGATTFFLASAQFHLGQPAEDAALELLRRLELVHTYFERGCHSMETVGTFGNQISVPTAGGDSHFELGRALQDGVGSIF